MVKLLSVHSTRMPCKINYILGYFIMFVYVSTSFVYMITNGKAIIHVHYVMSIMYTVSRLYDDTRTIRTLSRRSI